MEHLPAVRAERYVALGDSYTIGEGCEEHERWPNQLVQRLRDSGVGIDLVANPAKTGWTTANLLEREIPVLDGSQATFVTLLIGVNDWVQGVGVTTFRSRLEEALHRIEVAVGDRGQMLLVSIPDFSVTPEGGAYSRGRDIAAGLRAFNGVIAEAAEARNIPMVDIFPLSQSLGGPEYVAADGLHPNGAAYARWTDCMFPAALRLLRPDGREGAPEHDG